MPWKSGKAFAAKHNRKLTGAAASRAARVATAMVERGVPEGEAIATGNKLGNRAQASITRRVHGVANKRPVGKGRRKK